MYCEDKWQDCTISFHVLGRENRRTVVELLNQQGALLTNQTEAD